MALGDAINSNTSTPDIVDVVTPGNPDTTVDVELNPGNGSNGETWDTPNKDTRDYGHIEQHPGGTLATVISYTVTFYDGSGGTIVKEVTTGSFVTPPTVTRAGYTFVHWTDNPATNDPFDFSTAITTNLELWPVWQSQPRVTLTLTYNLPDGTVGPSASIYSGLRPESYVTIDEADNIAQVVGYRFLGWFTDEIAGEEASNPFYITADTELYAHWLETGDGLHTVTFYLNYNEAVLETVTVIDGAPITMPEDPTRTDYAFGGWYTSAACMAGTEFNPASSIYADTNLYAKWTSTAVPLTFPIYAHSFTQAEIDTMIANHNFRAFGVPIQATQGTPCNISLAIPSISAQQQYRFLLTPARFGTINVENLSNGPLITYVTSQWPGGFYTLYRNGAPISVGGPDGGVYYIHRSEQPIPGVWQVQATLPLS